MKRLFIFIALSVALLLLAASPRPSSRPQADDPNPPAETVKLIFIHHSTGENWLRDDYGGLGLALSQNNYFVSDTNYSWGPDSIGDRTDIPNWTEWFRSASTPTYMQAVFNESGQNSSYTRNVNDPGGENEIIMFKSCFPNSDLGGNPDDPPGTYEDMTVSGAKYVYNEILKHFATRPDKLFIVITAPPLRKVDTSTGNAANALAFNDWLVNDWLRENDYPYNNVAVFDFYNVLTGPDNHHRYVNGQIEHIYKPGTNTSHYPTEDSHPSAKGSQKATDEFIPLLNIFYHRWQERAPAQPPASEPPPLGGETQAPITPPPSGMLGLIDDFEAGAPAGTAGWETFWDESTSTTISCAPGSGNAHGGSSALQIDFDVAANSWATCTLFYGNPQDWSAGEGLSFYLRSGQAGLVFNVDIYAGTHDNQETYIYTIEVPPDSTSGWIPIELRWEDFHRADWEADAGTPFSRQNSVLGMAFGFSTFPDTPDTGTIWVDDVQVMGGQPPTSEPPAPEPTPSGRRICGGAFVLPLTLAGLAWLKRRR